MDDELENNAFVLRELGRAVIGEKLGFGVARSVYSCRLDPTIVFKIEANQRSFQNILEWEFWDNVRHDKEISKWLAPCKAISPSGIVLIQERTEVIRERELPKMVPDFATDLKLNNWGLLNKKPVIHDYGFTLSHVKTKLKKADW